MVDNQDIDYTQPYQEASLARPDTLMSVDQSNPSASIQKLLGKHYGGTTECVGIVQDPSIGGSVGHTSTWSPAPISNDTQFGAPIAIFDKNGKYANQPGQSHAARLMRRFDDGSMLLMDQSNGASAALRMVPATGKGGEGDASSYSIIIPKGGKSMATSTSDDDLINAHAKLFVPSTTSIPTPSPQTSQTSINNDDDLAKAHANLFGGNVPTPITSDEKEAYQYIPPGSIPNTPEPTMGQKLSQVPSAIGNAFAQGYSNTPNILGPETQGWLDKNASVLGQSVHSLNVIPALLGGATQALTQETPYQIGNVLSGPSAGRDLVGLTTAGLTSMAGSPSPLTRTGMPSVPKTEPTLPGKLVSDKIPGQPLTPGLQPGATPQTIAQEASLRAKFPSQFKPIDAEVNATNIDHLKNTLDPILNDPTKKILFNQDPKSPKFDQSLMTSDGKAIDPVKFNAWHDNLTDSLNKQPSGGLPPVPTDSTRFYHGGEDPTSGGPRWVSSNINYANGWSKKSGSPVSYVDIPNDHPSLVPNSVDATGNPVTGSGFGNFEAPADVIANMKPVPNGATTTNGPKFGGVKGAPKFDSDTLNALDDIKDSVNNMANMSDAAAKSNPKDLNNLGKSMLQRLASKDPGITPSIGSLLSGGLFESAITHGFPSLAGPGSAYAAQLGRHYLSTLSGPRAAIANQSAVQRILSQTINPPKQTYRPGAIIPETTPTAS